MAVVFGLMRSSWISDQNPGNEKMQEIGLAIREGATAFLVREYKVLTIFVLTVAALVVLGKHIIKHYRSSTVFC